MTFGQQPPTSTRAASLGASRQTFTSISVGEYRVDFWASGAASHMRFANVR